MGADLAGFSPADLPEVPEGGPSAYFDWVRAGMHGDMAYMARSPEDRGDIRRWFPAARSVVLAAFSYHDGRSAPPSEPGMGRLARYSLPPDYHDELKARMKRLQTWYEDSTGGKAKVFVDTSPVLERLYARHAGLGWVGKNTMLLSRRIGSFFLLAGLAVDRELDYDEPAPDHCGSCNRCLSACPTDAFPKPHVLDASRCIAYFTIESRKGSIPEGFREGVGDWVFGCDVCQDVCPWNRFAAKASIFVPALPPLADLEALADLTDQDFERAYAGTSLHRTGRRALVRNALLAMGNSGDRRHVPTLERFASGEDPALAEQARWSLRKLEFDKMSAHQE